MELDKTGRFGAVPLRSCLFFRERISLFTTRIGAYTGAWWRSGMQCWLPNWAEIKRFPYRVGR